MRNSSRFAHLLELLALCRPGTTLFATATAEALAEARALGPAEAAAAIALVLDGFAPGLDRPTAERAADVARQLRLAEAAPALVGCLERLGPYDSVAHAALGALERMPEAATAPLLAAFARSGGREVRADLAAALARAGARDGSVAAALAGMLPEDPIHAARCLAEHGDRRALPELARTLDRLELPSAGPGELRGCEEIVAVAQAIRALDGELTAAQRAKKDRAYARSDELWGSGADLDDPPER